MSVGLRIFILLCCAYGGWETAGVEFGQLAVPQPQVQFHIQ